MKNVLLPRHFLASGLLLLSLVGIFIYFETHRLRQEFLRQTEERATALAEAMEASIRNAIVGNAVLEDLISQRLVDNARLIDQLLVSGYVDQSRLNEISAMNRLQKIDILDEQGRPLNPAALPSAIAEKKAKGETVQRGSQTIRYAWGKRRWRVPTEKAGETTVESPPALKDKEFSKGSAFGVAVGARSFPGIIAVHANSDYFLNFEKEIGVQTQIENLGRHSDSEFIAFIDGNLKIVAHTDSRRIGEQEKEPLVLRAKVDRQLFSQIAENREGKRYFEVVKPVALDESNVGFIKFGLSLGSMEIARHNSLRAIVILSVAILAAGILGMAAIFHNQHLHLQEVKALEIEVLHRERLSILGNMAATVAHEIRNPLNSISMGLQRLNLEFTPADDHEDYSRLTEVMLGEVQRLNSLVEQFLTLARPVEIKAEALPLPEVLKELAALQQGQARDSNVQIQVITAPNMPPLMADPAYLTQVLLNLMLNGLHAMPDGGTLTLEAKALNGKCLIAVADTGAGIAPENQQHIFEPYFTTKVKGTGLGLAISRRIIETHGGTLNVSSIVGQGSRFEISMPLNAAKG